MAIAGFVLALVGLLILPVIMGPLAIIFSSLALKKGQRKGLAIAGLVIGIVNVAWWLITVL